MSAYKTVVVGTDGSDTSLAAVDRAASLAADAGATLVIACAYFPRSEKSVGAEQDVLGAGGRLPGRRVGAGRRHAADCA